MEIDVFKRKIREVRDKMIPRPREIVQEAMKKSSFWNEDEVFFLNNSTDILYSLRQSCWETFLEHEKKFTMEMGNFLVEYDPDIKFKFDGKPEEIVGDFLYKYSDHLFELSKSNTNSRRARAGKEFEAIIETILLRAGIIFDNQGIIGSDLFETNRLGKLVDCVVPGVIEYNLERRKCSLISMKTSLRERWQEVPEEMKRTGAQEMFLLTLDEGISKNTIDSLSSHNITLVVPDDIKEERYTGYLSVYGLTQFLYELVDRIQDWIGRRDLPSDYYEDKLKSISLRLEGIYDPYEREVFEGLRNFCMQKLKEINET